MDAIIKEILYYLVLGSGSIALICLLIAGTIRCICILIDHLKVANVLRKALLLYVKVKNPNVQVKDVDIGKMRYIKDKYEVK